MEFNLNRFLLNINEDTPHEVIMAWVACCGKNINRKQIIERRQDIIDYISNYKYILPPQKEYYSEDDYLKITNYVSPDTNEWQPNNLLRAMQHIRDFNRKLELQLPIKIGNKNNNNIFNYDIIMLYEYCYNNKIKTNINDNIDTLLSKIKLKNLEDNYTDSDCIEIIANNINNCDHDQLIIIMGMLKSHDRKAKQDIEIQTEKLPEIKTDPEPLRSIEEIKNNININYMISRSTLDENEALVYAAKFLSINLSDSEQRVKELKEYNRCHIEKESYIPLGNDLFAHNYKLNNYYYRLDHFWHPKIADLYPLKCINLLLKNEGLGADENKSVLDINLCNPNFYIGIIPGYENLTTYFHQKRLDEIVNNHVIFYGTRQDNDYKAFTPGELTEHFRRRGLLLSFGKNELLSLTSIKKLKSMAKLFVNDNDYVQLLEIITELEDKKLEKNSIIDEFKNKYLFASDQVDLFLEEVFFIAMYSRGWKINDLLDYPLNINDSINFEQYEKRICDNINISFKRINNFIDRIADKTISNMIYLLPIMIYDKHSKQFNEHKTDILYDKIKGVVKNDKKDYMQLRVDSEIISHTVYYYILALSGKKLFNLEKLN